MKVGILNIAWFLCLVISSIGLTGSVILYAENKKLIFLVSFLICFCFFIYLFLLPVSIYK